ncbi:MAG: hypothetical protein HYU02_00590 [Thaumarchaeota archaeon]|nr:hypothetical protein [Nitrososphaerota archaeon]
MEVANRALKAKAVWLILDQRPEEALRILCEHYKIEVPDLKVGLPKKHSKVAGCYVVHQRIIYVADRETLYNPFVILHEFYHHLRSTSGRHKGNEKYADNFAIDFIDAYKQAIKAVS